MSLESYAKRRWKACRSPVAVFPVLLQNFFKIPLCHHGRHSLSFGFDFVFDCHARHSPLACVPPLHSATRGPVKNLLLKGLWSVLAGCCTVAAFDWVILNLCYASVTLSWIRPSSQFFSPIYRCATYPPTGPRVSLAAPIDGFGFWKLIGDTSVARSLKRFCVFPRHEVFILSTWLAARIPFQPPPGVSVFSFPRGS